jgi:hypothetical protein
MSFHYGPGLLVHMTTLGNSVSLGLAFLASQSLAGLDRFNFSKQPTTGTTFNGGLGQGLFILSYLLNRNGGQYQAKPGYLQEQIWYRVCREQLSV